MKELLCQKDLESRQEKLDKGEIKIKKEEEKLSNFKIKQSAIIEKSYLKEKMKVEKTISKYEIKIKKSEEKYSDDNEVNVAKKEAIKEFCDSRIDWFKEELELIEENYRLAKEDIENGLTKTQELNIKFYVSSVKDKYDKTNFKLNMKELKKTHKGDKKSYQEEVRKIWEESDKAYTPLFIKWKEFKVNLKQNINKQKTKTSCGIAKISNYSFKDWATLKIWGIPLYLLITFSIIVALSMGFDVIQANMIYAFAILLVLATIFGVIFEKIPVFNRYMGGAVIGCMIIGALFVSTNLIPKESSVYVCIHKWFVEQGFLDFYVSFLLIGAVLSIPRKMIIKAFGGFFGIILIGTFAAFFFGWFASLLLGVTFKDLLINYALPILCAGNGGGIQPIDTMAKKAGFANWSSGALAVSTVASIISILFAAVLNSVGKSKQTLSGNGQLMKQDIHTTSRKVKIDHKKITIAILSACMIFILSTFISEKVITKDLVGIQIPNYAWMVILCLIINLINFMPKDIKKASLECNKWIAKQTTWLLMIGVGICYIDLNKFIGALNPTTLLISFMFVLGSTVGIMLTARLFKMNVIEATVSGGLCMTAQGGTGVVSVLGVSERMELMAFGQITCRIGGSLILVAAAGIFGIYGNA